MFLGIDIGTSEVKALLLDDRHRVQATSGQPLAVHRPQPGYSEQNPQDWWQCTLLALEKLRLSQPGAYAAVKAIGLSGQMHGATLLDKSDEVIRPAILWNDARSAQECQDMTRALPDLAMLAGTMAMPGFTAPKLLWLRRHEPQAFDRIRRVLLPKDHVRLKLTGEAVSDMSDASGTMWLDVAKRQWSAELLHLCGLSEAQMPALVEGSAVSGQLSTSAAQTLGLRAGIPVAGGGGDNAASAIGAGCIHPGSGFISLGTSGVIFLVTDGYRPNPASATHAFCHALPGQWHQMSVMLTAASALDWAARLTGSHAEALEAQAAKLTLNERVRCPVFLPYLSGERTPHNDSQVRGSLHGIDHDTQAAQLGYAVMEGISFGLADGLDALRAAGCQAATLALVGGGSRSAMWAQLLASVLDVEVTVHEESTAGAALGAARLAWLASGADLKSVCLPPPLKRQFTPDEAEQRALLPRLDQFRSLYRPHSRNSS